MRPSWVRELLDALPAAMPEGASWLNAEQIEADVQRTTQRDGNLAGYSAVAVFVTLLAGIYRPGAARADRSRSRSPRSPASSRPSSSRSASRACSASRARPTTPWSRPSSSATASTPSS